MANNPYVNKVIYGGNTLIDISDTTAATSDVASGKVFYTADGQRATGTGTGGGGGGDVNPTADSNDVNFIDYDGTIRYSYSAADFANLSALPANPTHSGLIAEGWNWTLADAKSYVASNGYLDIGQMYITDDGKTRIYIRLSKGRLSPTMGIAPNGTVTIDWGDGSTSTLTGTSDGTVKWVSHTYANAGDYVITLATTNKIGILGKSNGVQNSSYLLRHASGNNNLNTHYRNAIKKIELGNGIVFRNSCFVYCQGLETITIPKETTVATSSISMFFQYCDSLKALVIPINITNMTNMTYNSRSLKRISLPKGITSFSTNGSPALQSLAIPPSVTQLSGNFMNGNFSQSRIVIPSAITNIQANAFSNCYGLAEIHFKSTTPPTLANANAFTNVPTDCKIYVPTGTLSAYTSATNYPSSSTYTYVEE